MPLNFPSFCDHFFLHSKQLLIMYTFLNQSRIEKSWEKYWKQRRQDELPLHPLQCQCCQFILQKLKSCQCISENLDKSKLVLNPVISHHKTQSSLNLLKQSCHFMSEKLDKSKFVLNNPVISCHYNQTSLNLSLQMGVVYKL